MYVKPSKKVAIAESTTEWKWLMLFLSMFHGQLKAKKKIFPGCGNFNFNIKKRLKTLNVHTYVYISNVYSCI